jgi:hypothetical protein
MSVKIWKLSRDSTAMFAVSGERATMVGDSKNFITTSPGGNVIYGPTSIVAGSESIRVGGAYVSLPDAIQSLPSTQVTPLPGKISIPPVHIGFDLAQDVAFFAALLV